MSERERESVSKCDMLFTERERECARCGLNCVRKGKELRNSGKRLVGGGGLVGQVVDTFGVEKMGKFGLFVSELAFQV